MKNTVAALAIIASFAIGTIVTATPQVEAAGGWKEAFDQLLIQINVLEDKVQTLEGNAENCQNEFLLKQSMDEEFTVFPHYNPYNTPLYLENIYELSENCESEVIPLSMTAQDVSVTGTYFVDSTSWFNQETGEYYGEQAVYVAECPVTFDGEFSENATFFNTVTITSISVENDGTHQLELENSDGLIQSGLFGNIPELGMIAILNEGSDGVIGSDPEEIIGTFTVIAEFSVVDLYGNTVSDTATFTCSP